ncbi:MAG: nuclear transport factor 2 family protein, partial [Vicinamibacterales bacterium]
MIPFVPDVWRIRRAALALVFSIGAIGCGAQTSPSKPAEGVLAELQQVLARAWMGGDRAAVERIIAPEWRSIGPDGRITDRVQLLADVFETRVHKIQKVDIDDVQVRVFGDAAVVTGRTHGVG